MQVTDAPIPLFHHDLGAAELKEIEKVFAGPILTTGQTVATFERAFADYLGRKHAVGVTSCTGAMHLALLGLGIGPGDEVITTPVTFVATANAIIEAGAKPVFVDVEADTGNMDATKIEAAITPRTRAILPVHLYGQLCDMRAIRRIADRHRLFVIEDCAHCVTGKRDGVGPGELSHAACFSFYATKELTSGEGGALVTDDAALADRLRLLRLHGMNKTGADRHRDGYSHWDMVTFGWKYNMDNIQAAMLLPQLGRIEAKLEQRRALAARYYAGLEGIPGLRTPRTREGVRHAHYVFAVLVGDGRRDEIIAGLQERRIGIAVQFRAAHLTTWFRETYGYRPGAFPIAEAFGDATLCLPFYPGMPEAHVDAVVSTLRRLLTK